MNVVIVCAIDLSRKSSISAWNNPISISLAVSFSAFSFFASILSFVFLVLSCWFAVLLCTTQGMVVKINL